MHTVNAFGEDAESENSPIPAYENDWQSGEGLSPSRGRKRTIEDSDSSSRDGSPQRKRARFSSTPNTPMSYSASRGRPTPLPSDADEDEEEDYPHGDPDVPTRCDNLYTFFSTNKALDAELERRAELAEHRQETASTIIGMHEREMAIRKAMAAKKRKGKRKRAGEDSDYSSSSEDEVLDDDAPIPGLGIGLRRCRAILNAPYTLDEWEKIVKDDSEHLMTIPTPPLHEIAAQVEMGAPPPPQHGCFFCDKGGPSANAKKVNTMVTYWKAMRPFVRPAPLSKHIAKYFNRNVRGPANEELAKQGKKKMARMSPSEVRSHMENHSNDPESWLITTIERYRNISNDLYLNGVYVRNAKMLSEEHVNTEKLKAFDSCVNQILKLYNANPKGMVNYNPSKSIRTTEDVPVLVPGKSTGKVGPAKYRQTVLQGRNRH